MGRRVWATQTWEDNWNNVIRKTLIKDSMLLDMMMIPSADRSSAVKFIGNYFVRSAMPDALVTKEDVRIVYADTEGAPMNIPQMRKRYIAFDIYVKKEHLNNYDNDRLKMRHQLIAQRLRYLLTKDRDINGMTFSYVDDFDLGTKIVGYERYHLLMEYRKT